MIVLDSSALLTAVKGEPGAEVVASVLDDAAISVVNITEVISKVWDWGLDAELYLANLLKLSIEFVDFNLARAAQAGHLRSATRRLGLSLGDRACIGLAIERGCPVLTADRNWAKLDIGVPIHLIR